MFFWNRKKQLVPEDQNVSEMANISIAEIGQTVEKCKTLLDEIKCESNEVRRAELKCEFNKNTSNASSHLRSMLKESFGLSDKEIEAAINKKKMELAMQK